MKPQLIEFTTTIEVTVIARVTPATDEPDVQGNRSFGDTGSPAKVELICIKTVTDWHVGNELTLGKEKLQAIKEEAIVEAERFTE